MSQRIRRSQAEYIEVLNSYPHTIINNNEEVDDDTTQKFTCEHGSNTQSGESDTNFHEAHRLAYIKVLESMPEDIIPEY
jgi:hypothetical protein